MRHFPFMLLTAVLLAGPAHADFSVCNKAVHPTTVALGRFDGRQWMSEGWWKIASGKCTKIFTGALDARYYYLYANDGGSGTWDGSTQFCTATGGRFSIVGR